MSNMQPDSTLELSREEMQALGYKVVDILTESLRGRIVLRLCTINPRTTEEDIRETIRKLESFGRQLSGREIKTAKE